MKRPPIVKAPDALRSIGEVVDETGVPAHVLRYWEAHVPTLQPLRRAGGRRYFRAQDITLVRRLKHLTDDQGYTLDGAARAVRRGDGDTDDGTSPEAIDTVAVQSPPPEAMRVQLAAIRDRLSRALTN